MPIVRKLAKKKKEKKRDGVFFGKIGWQNSDLLSSDLLRRSPTVSVSFGIAEIIFWWIFQNNYYMEFLQINLVILVNFVQVLW